MAGPLKRGTLFVISAPSGTGKSSLARGLLARVEGLEFSVSYTTRPRRAGEEDGREYHFVPDERFDAMIAAGGFLEWAEVFGRRYGTGRGATEAALASGRDILLDIDVQGARKVRDSRFEAVFVFVLPPDFPALVKRLRSRGSEDEAQIARRLSRARQEAEEYRHYDYVVINDDLERAVGDLCSIVQAERQRTSRLEREADRILATFPGP